MSLCNSEDNESIGMLSEAWESLAKILKRPPHQRTTRSLQHLVGFTRNIKLFREMEEEVSEEMALQCCFYMTYEFFPQGTFVFQEGSVGTKFYILLQGTCSVYIHSSCQSSPVSQYVQGDSFGELALLHNKPRAASIKCATDVHLAVLEKEDYVRILAKAHETALNKKAEFLHELPMFASWTMGSMQKLIYYFKDRVLQRKQVLYKRGDTVETVYFIREGEVQIVQDVRQLLAKSVTAVQKFQVKKAEVATLGKGECVGAAEAIGSGVYPYTATCVSVTARVLAISKDDFLKRANTDDTLTIIKELTKVKEGLRKRQIEGGKNARNIGFCPEILHSEPDSMGCSPALSPKSTTSLLRNEESRLYPNTRKQYRIEDTASQRSPAFTHTSWDEILTRKIHTSRSQLRRKPISLKKIVNIHTYRWRQPDWKLTDDRLCERSAATTRLEVTSSSPTLHINSIEVITQEDTFRKSVGTPKLAGRKIRTARKKDRRKL